MEVLPTEIKLCKRKWINKPEENCPNSAIEAYIKCNSEYFPKISFLLNL